MERGGGMRGRGQVRAWGRGWQRLKQRVQGGAMAAEGRLPGGARTQRTLNMKSILVTLDVSQLDMSPLNCCRLSKRLDMSVMAETSQPSMGP